MRILRLIVFPLAIMSCALCMSCGSSGGTTTNANVTTPSQSFLPLMTGIRTTIEDGIMFNINGGERTKDVVVETNEDGIAITGGFTSEVSDGALVDDQLYLEEAGDGVVLSRYESSMYDADGSNPSTSVIAFDPPVVILQDREAMAVGDVYTTEHVDVTYGGDIYNHRYIPSQTEPSEDKLDTTVTVEVTRSEEVTIDGTAVTAYQLEMINLNVLPGIFSENPFFNNQFNWSWLTFWFARGIGIVGVDGAYATSTTADIP